MSTPARRCRRPRRRLGQHRAERLLARRRSCVQGADVVFIGSISDQLPFQLVSSATSNRRRLEGKKIAISRIGASTDVARHMLRHLG